VCLTAVLVPACWAADPQAKGRRRGSASAPAAAEPAIQVQPVAELLFSKADQVHPLSSVALSRDKAPEGKTTVSLQWTKDPALDIGDASLVLVFGPLPSEPGLQFYRKHYYHHAFDSAALAKGQLDFDVPTSVFEDASSVVAYLAHSSIPQPAPQVGKSGAKSEPGTVHISEFTDSRGITRGTYVKELEGGKEVTTHRTVYSFPRRMGAIEIQDIPGVETTVKIWATTAGSVPTDIPQEIREKLELTEGKRVSEVKQIDTAKSGRQ
jgi:hypothetical protein